MEADNNTLMRFSADDVPELRADSEFRLYENESVVWSSIRTTASHLDAIGTIVFQMVDGDASVDDLINDVHEVVGIDRDVAQAQIVRTLHLLQGSGLLTSSVSDLTADEHDLFHYPPST